MTDEEKRFDRREEARLDDMYDAQCETKGDDMNREDIIRMAREAGIGWLERAEGITEFLERFANLVYAEGHKDGLDDFEAGVLPAAIKEEREACAKVCDEKVAAEYATGKVDHNEMGWTQSCAIDIRARGEE